jgi:acyl-CoA ligase (AMP-forming) (exosortase A-associated)
MDFLVHHMLRTSAHRFPEKEALVHGRQRLRYKEVEQQVESLAFGLRRAGLQRGDRIGVFLGPSVPQVVSIFAISRAGGTFVPINEVLFPDQVIYIARNCGMKGLITSGTKLQKLASALKGMESLQFIVAVDSEEAPALHGPISSFEELVSLAPVPCFPDHQIDRDLAAILYTSGSTGKPKGVMLTHANIMAGASIVSTYLEITEAERILAVLPFSFDAGLNQLMTAFQQGGTLVLISFVFAREIVDMLQGERISGLAGVPTLWSLLVQPNSGLKKHQFPYLRYITNTGGAMPQSVLEILRQALPTTKIFLMYGLTEAFRSTYLPPDELSQRPTSMGKAIPNTEILVVNDDQKPCRPGEIGELVHRGPTVSLGYWGEQELTDRVLRPHPFLLPEFGGAEKVCYSGDLVKADEDGFLYFIGRRDTLIKVSGFRISPTEVEEVLFQSGMLMGAAVIGVPDEMLGQHIKAFVVPREGEVIDIDALVAFCSDKLPRHMIPKSFEILDRLPKTTSGKVDYPALRARADL